MRKPIIAGNWKMNKSLNEAKSFANTLLAQIKDIHDCEIIIAPPYTYLDAINQIIKNSSICLSAQTISNEIEGAFTGDISINMIKDCGCSHVIIGHSEQRQYHHESSKNCHIKCNIAMKNQVIPIYCVGETLQERNENQTLSIIKSQLLDCLNELPIDSEELIIAYEPVWAIGTGKVATPEQAQDIHRFIRDTLEKLTGSSIANKTRILYGGSVKPNNIKDLMKQPDIDGALVGGACLNIDSFVELIKKTNYVTH